MYQNEDPESTVPWPGFVDILSTVIIVFVFFMMITTGIIFILSEQAKKKAVEAAVKEVQSQVQQKTIQEPIDPTATQQINQLELENQDLKKEVHELTQLKSTSSQSNDQNAARDGDSASVVFNDMGVTLKPETGEFLKQQLPFKGKIMITALIPEGKNFNLFQEIALNRALNVRNILLQNGVANDHIEIKISVDKQPVKNPSEGQYGSVSIHFIN